MLLDASGSGALVVVEGISVLLLEVSARALEGLVLEGFSALALEVLVLDGVSAYAL